MNTSGSAVSGRLARRFAATLAVVAWLGIVPQLGHAISTCGGDCNVDDQVTIDDILTMVLVGLGGADVGTCTLGDSNADGLITVEEILLAVNNANVGCIVPAHCGDGAPDGVEECDDGGVCVGGSTAGSSCTDDEQCPGNGVCNGGVRPGTACAADAECSGGHCLRCRPVGGDGCAANCTLEEDIPFDFVIGSVVGGSLQPGTSGATVFGEIIPMLALPIRGSQVLTVGKERDGRIPTVIKAVSVRIPKIPVASIACACVRGVALQTCGGTLYEPDGTLSPSCTEGFLGAVACPADHPCAFVHGNGNAAAGVLGCDRLSPIDVEVTADASEGTENSGIVVTEFSGDGPAGSALAFTSLAIGTLMGACTEAFCTGADPPAQRGTPLTLALTTGRACCTIENANGFPGFTIGPACADGSPLQCSHLSARPPSLTGLGLAGAYPALDQPSLADICITTQLFAQ